MTVWTIRKPLPIRDPFTKHRLLAIGPMVQVNRPAVPPASPKHLTLTQLQDVRKAAESSGDPRALAVQLMAQLGLRRNEAIGLIWSDIDLENRTVCVVAQLGRDQELHGTHLHRRALKTLSSRRTLSISIQFAEQLRLRRDSLGGSDATSAFVVSLDGQRPVDPDALTRWLKSIGDSVGVTVSPHRLRHTAATLRLNEGVPLASVGKVLGHSDIRTTSVYARVLDRSADTALRALSDLLESSSEVPNGTSDYSDAHSETSGETAAA